MRALKEDPRTAKLASQERAMIDFALKLTETPWAMERNDVEQLKEAGFGEEEVVDIVLITCIFNFMNRLADGLGVELDPMLKALVAKHAKL